MHRGKPSVSGGESKRQMPLKRKKGIIRSMAFGFLRGRVHCTTQAPPPDEELEKLRFFFIKTGADILITVSINRNNRVV
jgi:hypothetical protein